MTLSIALPPHAEEVLRQAFGDHLDRAALEAIALEGYRAGKLSRYEIQRILGFDNRWEAEDWLGARGAAVNYSMEDLDADRRTLEEVLGPVKS